MITTQDANLAALVLREVGAKLRAQALNDKAARLDKVADELMKGEHVLISDHAGTA